MSLIRWNRGGDAWSEIRRVQQEMDQVLRDLVGYQDNVRWTTGLFPALNMIADEQKVALRCEMPGVPMDKVDITITGDTLTVKGERDLGQQAVKEASYHRRERRGGYFNRTINLPFEVDPEKAKASYKNGVLEVEIERAAKTKPRQITIKAE